MNHKRQCEMPTKKRKPCPIPADRLWDGHWLCHVHDPNGVYAKKLLRKRVIRQWVREIEPEDAALAAQFRERLNHA